MFFMFRDVPECSMFRVLSTPALEAYNFLSSEKIYCSVTATLQRVIIFRNRYHTKWYCVRDPIYRHLPPFRNGYWTRRNVRQGQRPRTICSKFVHCRNSTIFKLLWILTFVVTQIISMSQVRTLLRKQKNS